jgi:hypothetical protein
LRRFLSVALAGALIAATAISLYEARQKPAAITPTTADKILVEKNARRLTLFSSGRKLKEYRVALGFSPVGPKQREGDGRTPEGNYKIDFHKSDSAFHRALHISYPDAADTRRAAEAGVDAGRRYHDSRFTERLQRIGTSSSLARLDCRLHCPD